MKSENIRKEAIRVLKMEAEGVLSLIDRIDESFEKSVEMILNCKGKIVVTGMGKSGQIGRKISSTMSSTGTSSVFMHPAESVHGDLGVISNQDLVIAISNSGESLELDYVVKYVVRKGISLIAMTGNPESTLGRSSDVVLNIGVEKEACSLGLAPTTSSTATLAMGDALAMTVLKAKGFQESDYAEFHPGGSLGRRLLTHVQDVMHSKRALPLVPLGTPMREVFSLMTSKEVRGVAGVVDAQGDLIGIVTDGDVRRLLDKKENSFDCKVEEIMGRNPKTIDVLEMAEKALFMMEQFKILLLFVVDGKSSQPRSPVGILHLHDLIDSKIR